MSDDVKKLVDAFVALAKALPEVGYISVTLAGRRDVAGPAREHRFNIEARSDEGAVALSKRFGIDSLQRLDSISSGQHWMYGQRTIGGVLVHIQGPTHSELKPAKNLDSAVEQATAALSEVTP